MRNNFQREECSLVLNVPLTVVISIISVKDRDFLQESKKIQMVNESDCDKLGCVFRISKGPEKK